MKSILALSLLSALSFAGCKQKDKAPPAPVTTETKPAEPAAAAPSAPAAPAVPAAAAKAAPANLATSGIAECAAVVDTYAKFSACTKISEENRVVQDMNVEGLGGIVDNIKSATADTKEFAVTGATKQCKDTGAKLAELTTAAGC
ncbi:MAG: hypothetical protein JWP01_884 [Myxococcales bacterium]|nr:hypothetical protein [Myxococcales bacterium]